MTINYDLRKYLKILTIIIDFIENIWKFAAAMKLSGNRIYSMKLFTKVVPLKNIYMNESNWLNTL